MLDRQGQTAIRLIKSASRFVGNVRRSGKEFHETGPTTEKARRPNVLSRWSDDTDNATSEIDDRRRPQKHSTKACSTLTRIYLAIMRTRYAECDIVKPQISSTSIVSCPSGGLKSKFCSRVTRNRNSSWRASCSPRHERLPAKWAPVKLVSSLRTSKRNRFQAQFEYSATVI